LKALSVQVGTTTTTTTTTGGQNQKKSSQRRLHKQISIIMMITYGDGYVLEDEDTISQAARIQSGANLTVVYSAAKPRPLQPPAANPNNKHADSYPPPEPRGNYADSYNQTSPGGGGGGGGGTLNVNIQCGANCYAIELSAGATGREK